MRCFALEDTTLEQMPLTPQPLAFVPVRRKALFPALVLTRGANE